MCVAFTLEKGLPCSIHGMKINATLTQKQNLALTPQLQQAIKLLQMSAQELNTFVNQQAMENPLLEWQEEFTDTLPAADTDSYSLTKEAAENVWQSELPAYAKGGNVIDSDNKDVFETVAAPTSLREHLLSQAQMICPDADKHLVDVLIDGLDERGLYLENIAEVASKNQVSASQLQTIIDELKKCEPAGAFAQSISECFAIQLKDCDQLTKSAKQILENLPLLESQGLSGLAQTSGVDETSCAEFITVLRGLNPSPLQSFTAADKSSIVPDLILGQYTDGSWKVYLNPEVTPKLIINSEFYNELNRRKTKVSEWKYIQERYSNASWLVKALQQRYTTLIKVAEQLVSVQQDFFHKGPEAIKPLVLRQVADECGIHESTVSRTVRDKYIATPRGTFELKYFFSSATKAVGNDQTSARSIQQKIKAIIKLESKEKPYSDDAVVKMLKAQGVQVARRTVTKYREAMHILSSVERRRRYKQEANFIK